MAPQTMPCPQRIRFSQSEANKCVYIKRTHESMLIITIYVNDLGLAMSKDEMVKLT